MIFFAVLAIMSGLAMIGFYSWGVSDIDCRDFPALNRTDDDHFDDLYDDDLCKFDCLLVLF